MTRWEKVRSLAMEKQTELHRLVMQLQRDKMASLRWGRCCSPAYISITSYPHPDSQVLDD